jgi:hypothetical protein
LNLLQRERTGRRWRARRPNKGRVKGKVHDLAGKVELKAGDAKDAADRND